MDNDAAAANVEHGVRYDHIFAVWQQPAIEGHRLSLPPMEVKLVIID